MQSGQQSVLHDLFPKRNKVCKVPNISSTRALASRYSATIAQRDNQIKNLESRLKLTQDLLVDNWVQRYCLLLNFMKSSLLIYRLFLG